VRIVNVPLGARSYAIKIGPQLLRRLGAECARLKLGRRCAIITDTNVGRRYARPAFDSLARAGFCPALVILNPGEATKHPRSAAQCYDRLAATYLRGIAFVQVPTTLLAQVDSSVGGKVGVNLKAGKNLVGAFYQPQLVLCDLDTLRTLPEREYRAGLAEVVKYGIIYDAELFARLERDLPKLLRRDARTLAAIIARCCQIKAEVVAQDETESGLRSILNFGHTIGHALEAISHYGRYLHGEAIAIGQVAAARISACQLGLPRAQLARIIALLDRIGLPTHARLNTRQRQKLFAAMRLDKKVRGGEIRFVLAKRIGQVVWGQRVPDEWIEAALDGTIPDGGPAPGDARPGPMPSAETGTTP